MIVYKQVYKKDNKYYSLMNYGYCRMNKTILTNQPPYEIGKTYISNNKECNNLKKYFFKQYGIIPSFLKSGFYFWKENLKIIEFQKRKMIECGADINAILKCKIDKQDVLSFERNGNCIRTKKFKVLEELIL